MLPTCFERQPPVARVPPGEYRRGVDVRVGLGPVSREPGRPRARWERVTEKRDAKRCMYDQRAGLLWLTIFTTVPRSDITRRSRVFWVRCRGFVRIAVPTDVYARCTTNREPRRRSAARRTYKSLLRRPPAASLVRVGHDRPPATGQPRDVHAKEPDEVRAAHETRGAEEEGG